MMKEDYRDPVGPKADMEVEKKQKKQKSMVKETNLDEMSSRVKKNL